MDSYCLYCHTPIRQEGSLLELFYVDDLLCKNCRHKLNYYPKVIYIDDLKVRGLFPYQGLIRELILQYKENNDEALYPIFLYPYISKLKKRYADYVMVPLPSSVQANEKRGFKHVNKMASILGLETYDLLYKSADITQKNLTYNQRAQIKNYLRLSSHPSLNNKKILLVDDILTSGHTLKSAYELLKNDCLKVEGLVLCYNQNYLQKLDKMVVKYIV